MAVVKARDQVTIAIGVDVASVDIYYKLQPSTSAAPQKPTIANPSDWTTTEPTYNDGSTNTLYTCQKTTLTDGTFYWSAVSKSTAYEAAKTAWNIANNTQQNLNNLRVGGENLIIMDSMRLGRIGSTGEVYTEGSDDGIHHYCTDFIPVDPDTNYTLSWFIKITEDTKAYLYLAWYDSEKEFIARSISAIAQSNKYNVDPGHETFSSPSTAAYVIVSANRYFIIRCALKFEKGNIPTDWSPSPSDTKIVPNILRGTNQSGTLDTTFNSSDKTWADGIWTHGSGNATNGSVAEIDVDDYKDPRIKHGFRIWSTTSANKDIAQWYPPFVEGLYRLLLAVRLSPEVTQTSATLQLRIYSSSTALKTYTTSITSTDWTEKTWLFWLSQSEAAAANRILIGVKGKGYLDVCAIYMKKGTFPFLPYKVYDADNWIPWAPAEEDSALYNEINNRFSQVENDIQSKIGMEDVENTVVATHRIYYRTATAQSTLTGPTTWVPEAESDAYNVWTTKKPPLASSVASGATKYPFLYTCEQRELLDGTIECTAVQLDDSTTVVDGGQIVTNSITAQQIAANTITTNELNTNQLTIGVDNIDDFDTTVSDAIVDAINDISIGGRNLLKGTGSIPDATNVFNIDRSCKYAYGWYTYSTKMSISVTSEGVKYTHDGTTSRDGIVLYFVDEDICAGEEDLILSCEYRTDTASWYNPYLLASTNPNIMDENPMTAVVSESVWQKGEWKLNFPSSEGKVIRAFLFGYINDANGWIEIKRNTLKLEKGNKATVWSSAPEDSLYDLSETIESVESRANSFCPTSFNKDDPTKWYTLSYMGSTFTKLDNGWYHYNYDNTAGESAISQYIAPTNWSLIQPGEMYTILFEIKNFSGATIADAKGLGYLQAMAGAQFYGNSAEETVGLIHDPGSTYFWSDDISEDGLLTFRLFKRADTNYIGESSAYDGMCFRYRLYATAGYVTSYDFRISIYPGKYYGDYTPYLVNSTYNKLASVDTDILGVVSDLNTEISARKATYGTCSTAAGTAAKIVICDGFDSDSHPRITVYFTTANTAAAPTLTIQDSDGATLLAATPIWNGDKVAAAANPVLWGAKATLSFIYDGTNFLLDEKAPSYSITSSTGASTRAKAQASGTFTGVLVVNGTTAQVLFSSANTYALNSVQFNFCGTGAANIYRNRAVTSTTNTLLWSANTVLTFVRYAQYWYLADNGTRTMAENAEKSATNFITEVSNDGIWITPSDAKPVSGAAAATTSGWHIADALELFRQGVNMFKVWVDSATKMWLRLGDEDGGHILMGPDEIKINNGELEAYKITASAETDEESNTQYESWLELSGAYIHSTEYADSTGNTISNQNALVADNHMGGAAVSAESWVDEHDFYWGRSGGGESEVVATGYSAVNLSGNVLVLDDQHSSGTRTYPFDMTDVIATLRSGACTILFSGSYSTTYNSAITGLPDLTNYMRLLVEYEDNTGRRGSVWVSAEDGGTLIGTIFGCTTTGGNNSAGLVIRSKSYKIALTSIDTDRDSYNRLTYGKVTVSPSNGITYANSQEIGIVRVFGFR